LTNAETEALVRDATAAADVVIMIEIDPREGSGVIPNDWSAFLGPAGNEQGALRGTDTPRLANVKALHGVYARDYNNDLFWVTFPATRPDGTPLLPSGTTEAILSVRIAGKEGRVTFAVPTDVPKQ
jgi:hypothetical protein